MNTTKTILEETGSDIQNFKSLILNLIHNQINNYEVQYLSSWEANHKLSPEHRDRKIEKLQITKKEIIEFLNKLNPEKTAVNFKINLEFVVNDKTLVKNSEKELATS